MSPMVPHWKPNSPDEPPEGPDDIKMKCPCGTRIATWRDHHLVIDVGRGHGTTNRRDDNDGGRGPRRVAQAIPIDAQGVADIRCRGCGTTFPFAVVAADAKIARRFSNTSFVVQRSATL